MQCAERFGFTIGFARQSRFAGWPVLAGGENSGLSPSAKFVISLSIISFCWANMDSDALLTSDRLRRGGISNAAKALHRSQPRSRGALALLEQALGVPLFERIAGRTMLSDAGKVMVPYAERAVAPRRMRRMRSARWRSRSGRSHSRWSDAGGGRRRPS